MAQLIQLEEAATLLGMKPEALVELRSRGEIHGYRDGSTWKFKETELERYASMNGITIGSAPAPTESTDVVEMAAPAGSSLSVDEDLDEIVDVGELEELKLEDSGEELLLEDEVTEIAKSDDPTAESTMIGKKDLAAESGDLVEFELDDEGSGLDLEVAGESSISLGSALDLGSEIKLDDAVDAAAGAAGVAAGAAGAAAAAGALDGDDEELSMSPSDSEISIKPTKGGSEISLDLDSAGSSLKMAAGSEVLESGGGLDESPSGTGDLPDINAEDISLDDGDDLDIDLGSSLNLSDDEMELSVDSSEELNLDSSDIDMVTESGLGLSDPADSDVTLDPSGSGINLSPSDSGLSLERTPPELAMSGDDELELGEAEELVDFGEADIELDDDEGLQTEDFVLTPVEGDLGDEDSGSQVIALDTDDLSDDGGMLDDSDSEDMGDGGLGSVDAGPTIPGPIAPVGSDSPYSIWDVVGFGMIMLPLTLTGIMVIDLALHIWSFDKPFSMNSQLMDLILGLFGS